MDNNSSIKSVAQSIMHVEKQLKIHNKIKLLTILKERNEISQEEYIAKIKYLYNNLK